MSGIKDALRVARAVERWLGALTEDDPGDRESPALVRDIHLAARKAAELVRVLERLKRRIS